jgi:uncharacterized protein YqhQ
MYRGPLGRLPFVRGLTILWDSLGLGMRGLMFSANVAVSAELAAAEAQAGAGAKSTTDTAAKTAVFEGPVMGGIMVVALALAVGLFIVLPKLAAAYLEGLLSSALAGLVIEGIIRLALFVGYVWAIGHMEDIRRVFAYHGAEHKTINAYEAGAPLTVEGVRPFSTAHTRCGTAFLLTLVILSIVIFAPLAKLPLLWAVVARVVLVPVLAMLAYEFIRFTAGHYHWGWMRAMAAPSLALQRLTTREPDDSMIEVAITALQHVLEREPA